MRKILISDCAHLIFFFKHRVSSLHLVDALSSVILKIAMVSLGYGSIVPIALSALAALVCAVAMSTCCESVIFALFARPYDLGDVIILVSLPVLRPCLADKK